MDEVKRSQSNKFKKAQKGTKLVIALQNRVREMLADKLAAAEQELAKAQLERESLGVDIENVTTDSKQRIQEMQSQMEESAQTAQKER